LTPDLKRPKIIIFSNIIMDPNFDYIAAHLQWIEQHPSFGNHPNCSYRDIMGECYTNRPDIQETAYLFLKSDIRELEQTQQIFNVLKNPLLSQRPFAFITVGYKDDMTPRLMKSLGDKIASMKYWSSCKYVHEKFRESGIHYHTHFLVELVDPLKKSKIVQFVHQIVKKYVLCKNFVDVKTEKDNRDIKEFQKYIIGDKRESKLPFVEKDRVWRSENNL